MDLEELGRRDGDETSLAGGAAGRQVVEDVRRAADVVVVRHATTDSHATVDRRRDEDHLIVTARSVEAFPLAVLLARHCNRPFHYEQTAIIRQITTFNYYFVDVSANAAAFVGTTIRFQQE